MHAYLRQQGRGFLALLLWRVIQQVRLKVVELSQLVCRKVPLNLLLVHHPERQRLFGNLPVIDFLLHSTLKEENDMRRQPRKTLLKHQVSQESTVRVLHDIYLHQTLYIKRSLDMDILKLRRLHMRCQNFLTLTLRDHDQAAEMVIIYDMFAIIFWVQSNSASTEMTTILISSPGPRTCTQRRSLAGQSGRPWRYFGRRRRGSRRRRRWWPCWLPPGWFQESRLALKWGTNDLWERIKE